MGTFPASEYCWGKCDFLITSCSFSILCYLFVTSRWPPLTTQANYSNFMLPRKSALPQSLLPLSQGSQPEVAELETGQLTQGGQYREVRTLAV